MAYLQQILTTFNYQYMEEERKKMKDAILAKMEWWKWKNDEPYFGLAHSLKENNDKEFFIRRCRKYLTTLERIEHLKSLMLNNSMCAKLNEVQMKWLDEYSSNIAPMVAKGKRGRPKVKELKDYIRVSDKERFIKELKELSKDRKGKELAAYIQAIVDYGLMEYPSYKALIPYIEGIGNKRAYSRCKTGGEDVNNEQLDSAKSYIKTAFTKYIEEIENRGK